MEVKITLGAQALVWPLGDELPLCVRDVERPGGDRDGSRAPCRTLETRPRGLVVPGPRGSLSRWLGGIS